METDSADDGSTVKKIERKDSLERRNERIKGTTFNVTFRGEK